MNAVCVVVRKLQDIADLHRELGNAFTMRKVVRTDACAHISIQIGYDSLVNKLHRPIKRRYSSRSLVIAPRGDSFSFIIRSVLHVNKVVVNGLYINSIGWQPPPAGWQRLYSNTRFGFAQFTYYYLPPCRSHLSTSKFNYNFSLHYYMAYVIYTSQPEINIISMFMPCAEK